MNYKKTGRGILFCVVSVLLTLPVQSNAIWRKLFVTATKKTSVIQRATSKITTLFSTLWYGSGAGSAFVIPNKTEIRVDKPVNQEQETATHYTKAEWLNDAFRFNFLARGAGALFNITQEDIDLFGLTQFLSNGPQQETEELAKLFVEEGRMDTQIGAGDCGGFPVSSDQFKHSFEKEL